MAVVPPSSQGATLGSVTNVTGTASATNVLTATSSTAADWEAPTVPTSALTQLYNLVRATDGTFDQSGISGSYNDLYIQLIVRSDKATAADTMGVEFNNDTGSNYGWNLEATFGTSVPSIQEGNSADRIRLGDVCSVGDAANFFAMYQLWIPGYASTTWVKQTRSIGGYPTGIGAASGREMIDGFGIWNSTAAITRIKVFPTTGTNWKTGSVCRIYGVT